MIFIGQMHYIKDNNWLNFQGIWKYRSWEISMKNKINNWHYMPGYWVIQTLVKIYRYSCPCSFNKMRQANHLVIIDQMFSISKRSGECAGQGSSWTLSVSRKIWTTLLQAKTVKHECRNATATLLFYLYSL